METKKEFAYKGLVINGFVALFGILVLLALIVCCFVMAERSGGYVLCGGILLIVTMICLFGFVKQEPNEAKVLVFFGKYSGTFTKTGFYWVNPLLNKKSVSLRARNLNP